MKNIFASVFVLLSLPSLVVAQETKPWTKFGETTTRNWSFRNGSFEIETTKSGKEVASILIEVQERATTTTDYYKWYVTAEDCARGQGYLVTLSVNNDYLSETAFVSKGESIAATGADMLCLIYTKVKSDRPSKEI